MLYRHATSELKRFMCTGFLCSMLMAGGTASAAENLRMSTLGPGTSPYIVMNTFATIVNNQLDDYAIQVNATGAATRHAVETAQGRSHFFMSSPNLYHMMITETGPYSSVPGVGNLAENLRTVFNFPMGYYHVATFANSDIESFDDIGGKKVFLGPPGSAAYQTAKLYIEGMTGFEPEEDYDVVSLGWDAAAQSFQDGHIDVYFNPTLPPSPVISQITLTNEIRLLGIPDEKLNDPNMQPVLERPGFRIGEIPVDAYGDGLVNEGNIRSVGITVGLAVNKDVPETAVYDMTKAFWEGLDLRAAQIPVLKNITLDDVFVDINTPLHAGAERYYREVGLEIPEAAVEGRN
ncbi:MULTISPECIES: TAXI family TRAP transporter solute-binding subunit [unclassified Halomonas]|uniref:TAXI family TRAP transporter solute-binding subunit n=1 Tax=unclassified Halomonas TaxID=2609666 RepID=UPI0040347B86